jgi:hypothetical protein
MDTHNQHESPSRFATGVRIATIVVVLGTLAATWHAPHTDTLPVVSDTDHVVAAAPDMSVYFPDRFPAPQGPIEPQPPTF